MSKLRKFTEQLAYVPQTLKLVWTASRRWTLVWLVLLCCEGILPAALIYLSRSLVNSLAVAIGTGGSWDTLWPAAFPAALMAGVVIASQIVQGVNAWIRTAQAELVRDHLAGLVHEKSLAVDLAFYESPKYHDQLERARNDLVNRPLALLESLGSLLQSTVTLIAMAGLLVPYGVWLPCALVLSTIPGLFVVVHFNRKYHEWWERTTSGRRLSQYYDTMLTQSVVAPELRLFGLGRYFESSYQGIRARLRAERLAITRDQGFARLGAGLTGVLISGLALLWMLWRTFQGRVTLGDLALFYQAFQRGQDLLRSLLENVAQIYSNTLFLRNLFEFLELKSEVLEPLEPRHLEPTVKDGIRFENITYSYPGSERCVLQNLDLTIPAGQVVALVGANGAGKSTLLKLLCRFYDPQSGRITIDGTDIRDVSLAQLRRMCTVLFQWPVPYQVTAAENIYFGDIDAERTQSNLETAARGAGSHDVIQKLSKGYDSLLGKWFEGGVELSIGEWQRLALARAFFRRAPVLILDEPTSALDSWAEADWFDRLRSLANGRTAIIITHRFTIARRADVIHVMDAGRILESGNHDQLLAQGGMYARSWATQLHGDASNGEEPLATDTDSGSLFNGAAVKV